MESTSHLDAARHGIAFGPPLARGLLRLTGSQRLAFLHRIATQDVARLEPPQAAYTAFLDGRARVIGEGMVVARADEVLLDVDPAAAPALRAHLQKFVLRDDVKIAALDPGLRVVPLLGPGAAAIAAEVAAVAAWPNVRRGAPAWDVLVAESAGTSLRDDLRARGAVELAASDLEVLRIEGGVARWGAELDDGRLVMEAALTRPAVSFEKGCYLGQEIVLRGTFRGQVQRGLVQVALPPGTAPGAQLRAGEQSVGVVTSAAEGPDGWIGLAYLRRAHWAPGTRLATEGGEAVVRSPLVEEKD